MSKIDKSEDEGDERILQNLDTVQREQMGFLGQQQEMRLFLFREIMD